MTTATASAPVTEQLGDEALVSRVVEGDSALFEILVRRHNQRIYRAVRAVLRSDEHAEDVMQQAYLSAYEHLHQFAGAARFSTWLTRIAVNEALRRRNGRAFAAEGDDGVTLERLETNDPDPEQQTSSGELRAILEREVEALPDSYRAVVVLRDVEGLSTAEAAECLSVSEDVVKTRLHRARAMLRENLYKRAGVNLDSLFTFGNSRCDRVVAVVMTEISSASRLR